MFTSQIVLASAMKLPERIAFSLFGFDVYWLGLLIAVGVIAAITLMSIACKRKELPADTAIDLCLITLPCGVIGARIAYVLLHLSSFKGRAITALYLWDGGLSLVGGAIAALIGILIYAAKKHIRYLRLLDVMAPAVTAALAVSSWCFFFDQSFYGPSVAAPALKWFPLCVRLDNGEIHLALFFYLFVWLVLTFLFLWFYVRKQTRHDGDETFCFLLLFSFAIAVLSSFRRDGSGAYTAELLTAAIVFFLTLMFLLIRSLREKRIVQTVPPVPEEAADEEAEADTPEDVDVCDETLDPDDGETQD